MEPLTISPRKTSSFTDDEHQSFDAEGGHAARTEPPVQEERHENFLVEIFKFSILALFIVVPFRIFVAQPFIVSGASMSPTFETGQYLIVDQVTYRFEEPKRGDVIIFRFPNDPSKYFIKRIIGLPGEIVTLANGVTTIKDPATQVETTLDEDYLVADKTDDHVSTTLSEGEYFVMGDNRPQSSDSRMWGPVPRKNIVGRALIRLLPPTLFGVMPGSYVYHAYPTITLPEPPQQ